VASWHGVRTTTPCPHSKNLSCRKISLLSENCPIWKKNIYCSLNNKTYSSLFYIASLIEGMYTVCSLSSECILKCNFFQTDTLYMSKFQNISLDMEHENSKWWKPLIFFNINISTNSCLSKSTCIPYMIHCSMIIIIHYTRCKMCHSRRHALSWLISK